MKPESVHRSFTSSDIEPEQRPRTRLLALLSGACLFLAAFSALLLDGSGVVRGDYAPELVEPCWLGFSRAECIMGAPVVLAIVLFAGALVMRFRETPRPPGSPRRD